MARPTRGAKPSEEPKLSTHPKCNQTPQSPADHEHRGQGQRLGWPEARRPDSAGGRTHPGAPAERGSGEFTGRRLHHQEERETEAGEEGRLLCEPTLHLEGRGNSRRAEGSAGPAAPGQGRRSKASDSAHGSADPAERDRAGLETAEAEAAGRASAQMREFQPSLKVLTVVRRRWGRSEDGAQRSPDSDGRGRASEAHQPEAVDCR